MAESKLDLVKSTVTSLFTPKVVKTIFVVAPTVLGAVLYKKYKRCQRRKAYPKDTVILHQYPRGVKAPSPSPWSLKLETWLRMTNIKYQNEFGFEYGPKGKIPWITYNGEDVPDSQFIIEYLEKKLDINLGKDFTESDLGIARAFFKMTEESLAWVMALERVNNPDPESLGFPKILIVGILRPIVKKRSKAQGYGLHSREEMLSIGKKDLKSINDFIGNKKFLLGDKPCNEDSAVFGMLCQLMYHERGPISQFIYNECPNILRYVETLKTTYWPDWNQLIKKKD